MYKVSRGQLVDYAENFFQACQEASMLAKRAQDVKSKFPQLPLNMFV